MTSPRIVRATDLECETGLSNDLLRKWRSRYGFPIPVRIGNLLGYTDDQVGLLRRIKHLLDGGFRPGQIVGKTAEQLDELMAALGCRRSSAMESPVVRTALDRLRAGDLGGMATFLAQQREKQSLEEFVCGTLAPLTVGVGEAWVVGEIEVYQEHLCTGILTGLLFRELSGLVPKPGAPRVVFATPSDELHVLGLLMAQTMLADRGAECIYLGPHTPLDELSAAARSCRADIVAISLSSAFPAYRGRLFIKQLRNALPAEVKLWLGGGGAREINPQQSGVRIFSDLREAANELDHRCELGFA